MPRFLKATGLITLVLALALGGCGGGARERPRPGKIELAEESPVTQRLREAIGYYLAADYKYGGTERLALDCSAFVMKVYERAGIRIPRTTVQQYEAGEPVSLEELRYGDLVFFNKYSSKKYSQASILGRLGLADNTPSHVGIYLGNGRFIHASASQGGVTISSLNQDGWKRAFIGSRRYLP